MHTEDLQMTNGITLRFNPDGLQCWNIFQVISMLCDDEYTAYGFCYYGRWNGKVYVHKGNWDSAANPNNWEKIHG